MAYLETLRMRLKKIVPQTQQKFEISVYNDMLDAMDTLAGITPVASLTFAPNTYLYDGRMIITRDTKNIYVYNYALSIWEQANIQTPAQISTSELAMLTTAQRSSLSRVNLKDGTVIFNTTLNKVEIYKAANFTWYDAVANVTFVTADPAAGGGSASVNFTILGTESTVGTSTASNGTASGNQRKIDRTQNGVLWQIGYKVSGVSRAYGISYSVDNGATWSAYSAIADFTDGTTYAPSASFFIDIDDYAHVVAKSPVDGYFYYTRGTPNTARTAYTWSAPFAIEQAAGFDYSDIVAFRNPSVSGGWLVAIICSWTNGSSPAYATTYTCSIASDGTRSVFTKRDHAAQAGGPANTHSFPSIDFRHNGDGKTIDVQPDLFFSWSTGATGTGLGIRFKKATYSAGSWTFGTEREIDSTNYYINGANALCHWDGSRVVIAGVVYNGSTFSMVFYDRDLADTTTVTSGRSFASSTMYSAGTSYDKDGNVYVIGRDGTSNQALKMVRWNRSANTLESPVTIDSVTSGANQVSCRRGYAGGRLDFIWTDGTASPWTVKYNSLTGIPPGIQGTVGPVVTISSNNTLNVATALGNQRKVDRTQNGVLWEVHSRDTNNLVASYSADNGATWSVPGVIANNSGTYTTNSSLFIDIDDYAHVVYKDMNDGYIKYMRGTPNTARTAYTWSAATAVVSATFGDHPDIVAFRDPNVFGGWVAAIACTYINGSNNYTSVYTLKIAANGSVSNPGSIDTGTYGNSNSTFPSIDFRHTGDGKTVSVQPDLFIGWSAGKTGAGGGIRFKKLTYTGGGAWSLGAEREIDTNRYGALDASIQCMWDGSRVIIAGSTTPNADVVVYERDLADTATTQKLLITGPTLTSSGYLLYSSSTYDKDGNIYIMGIEINNPSGSRILGVRKWNRTTNTFEPRINVDTTANNAPHVSLRRGYKTTDKDQLDFVYTSGTASPYTVKAGKIT